MRTSFHHQPEAQHPKSPAIETPAGRLPHLLAFRVISLRRKIWSLSGVNWTSQLEGAKSAFKPNRTSGGLSLNLLKRNSGIKKVSNND
jgi:hypothetical protein